jgi:hypothetical protein
MVSVSRWTRRANTLPPYFWPRDLGASATSFLLTRAVGDEMSNSLRDCSASHLDVLDFGARDIFVSMMRWLARRQARCATTPPHVFDCITLVHTTFFF